MKNYKVFIPCAGTGSRLDIKYNKALVTVGQKPVISYIIDKFPLDTKFVIALGYDGKTLKEVINVLYPNRNIEYVKIDPYEGEGSGLGTTLLQSSLYLNCPFIFYPCDSIVLENIPEPTLNWMGYANIKFSKKYRSIRIDKNVITEICSKNAKGDYPYIGICGIKDYQDFWKNMKKGVDVGSIESGEAYGLKHLLSQNIHAQEFTWFDTGNKKSLSQTRKYFKPKTKANILPKDNEAIWFINNKVIKFSLDSNFIFDRVYRANSHISDYVPQIIHSTEHTYSYNWQIGKVLSTELTINRFDKLLTYLKDFWQQEPSDTPTKFSDVCHNFYYAKTIKRIKDYFKKFEQIDQKEIINLIYTPSIWEILAKVDWKWLCQGIPAHNFHGDLHFENILVDDKDNFTFLDWRQNFAGLLTHGDIYYDLAKLLHGIIISHEVVNRGLFSHSISNNKINFDFYRKNTSVELEKRFKSFVIEEGYDYNKVQYLTYLIFLNIASMHHYPYGLLLFHLGKVGLYTLLSNDKKK